MRRYYVSMKKILLLGLWFIATITTFSTTALLLTLTVSKGQVMGAQTARNVQQHTSYELFTAVPSFENIIDQSVTIKEARVAIVEQFLKRFSSPLLPHAKLLVETADKHNLDFRLLPAVAMQESGLCKIIPNDSYNCWGYGIYGDKVLRFASFEEAIETVAKGLSVNYIYDGLTTPELIMSRYTPSSDGSWARAVRHFMEQME